MTSDFAELPRHYAGAILADPPRHFMAYLPKGRRKSPKYACLSVEQVAAFPVHELAGADSVLLLRVIQTHMPMALQVMQSWRFDFKTTGAWAKLSSTGRCWRHRAHSAQRC
jgi:N6-adenosine-specific RNA methylase IME4